MTEYQKWTEAETELARANLHLRAKEFLEKTGRTRQAAKCHLNYVDNPETARKRAEAKAAYKRTNEEYRAKLKGKWVPDRNVPPPEVIEDAIRRATAPRSITAILCGDPCPGFSALDRKQAGASA